MDSKSKELKLNQKESEYFQKALNEFSKSEEKALKKIEEPHSIYDLIDILLQRIPSDNLEKMSELVQESLQPSISLNIGDDLNSFCVKIGDSPSLMFEESIQQEMERFIENRFEVDKKVVAQKTADIARLISLMNKYLGDAIDSNKDGTSNVTNIKNEIESINISGTTKDELNRLQAKLVQAAITIENEMSSVNKNLQTGRDEVSVLEQRVQKLEDELAKTKQQTKEDALTGTLNRRAYEEKLNEFESEYDRMSTNYAVIFFDIDHFKKVNDNYGHECGDVVLKTFSALLMKLTRENDVVARYGGEEFVVALHYNNSNELYKYVNRIKSVITKNKFIYKTNKLKITFSAGVQLRSQNNSIDETIANADKLLYEAKQTGRNKIIFWDKKEL